MNGLFIVLLIWGSFFFSNSGGDPGFAVRHLAISLFCLSYVSYFILYRRLSYPVLGKWQKLSLFGYFMFTIVGLLSSVWGVNSKEGIYPALIHFNFIILMLVTVHAFNNGLKLRSVSFLIALIGLFSGVFGCMQYYELLPEQFIAGAPPTALQFNRNFFGSSQVLILPFALVSTLASKGLRRYISLTSLSVIFLSILISQTRSAVLSLLVFGVVVLAVIINRSLKGGSSKQNKLILWTGVVGFMISVAVIGSNNFRGVSKSITKYFQTNKSVERRQNSIEERFDIWRGSLEIVKSHPVGGVGFGNWKIHYAANTNQPYRAKSGRIVIAKAHNVYLEFLNETGMIGMSFYAVFLLGILLIIYKSVINDTSALFFVAGFYAFLLDYLFSFGNYQPSHMIYSGVMLGYLLYIGDNTSRKYLSHKVSLINGVIAVVLTLLATYWSYSMIAFEESISKGQVSSSQGDFQTALYHFDNAVNNVHSLNRQGDSPHLQKAFVFNKMKRFDDAIKECHLAWKDNPFSSRLNATFGASYFAKHDLKQATIYYQKAFNVQSRNLSIAEKLAICYFQMKDFQRCIEVLDRFDGRLNPNLQMMLKVSKMSSGQFVF